MDLFLRDFYPFSTWEQDEGALGLRWDGGEPQFVIDQSTRRKYLNEFKGVVRIKCLLLIAATPIVHPIASFINVACKIVKLVSFYHFFKQGNIPFKERVKHAGKDLLKIAITPLALPALEMAAIYGIFAPYNGRKLYASFERALYENFFLAPCFQPEPTSHAFGGDINRQNAF